MTDWYLLVGNFAVVGLFISIWVHGQYLLADQHRWIRDLAFGTLMGCGAVATIALAVRLPNGAFIDLRASIIGLAGFFGGPIAAFVAAMMAAAFRIKLGGYAVEAGVLVICLAGIVGISVSRATRGRLPALWSAVLLSFAVAALGPTLSYVLTVTELLVGSPISLQQVVLNFAATGVSAFFIMRHRVVERERDLLRAAFEQSPDYQYVKSRDSRFVAVNRNVVKHQGFEDGRQMLGKTDRDLVEADRAAELLGEERRVLEKGEPFFDHLEMLTDVAGRPYWYSTSKVPLRDADGEIIGLAGVTRDVTRQKGLEQALTDSRNQLSNVLAGISDGVAMIDGDGVLVYCNEQYRSLFPRTSHLRQPGAKLRDILMAVAETGEQILPRGEEEEWVETRIRELRTGGEEETRLFDGRWLYVRTRPTADGAAMVVVSDVTKIKQAEETLRSMTDQLKLLATTDGLTGLTNRRALDMALETESARCRRNGEPLSLLMVDVDRFKAYNDLYGHQAGDEVLKQVGVCLRESLRRPTDLAARYGGEEFVAILPGTDEDGAFFIADAFRAKLKALNIVHEGSEKKVVTASVGLATFTSRDEGMNATELVRRADEALYNAKGAGRDRVTGWRPRHEVRPVSGARY